MNGTGIWAGRVEHYELARTLDRKRLQQDLVEQRENRGVRANPEPQRHHRDNRKAGTLPQHSQPVPQVLNQQLTPSPCLRTRLTHMRNSPFSSPAPPNTVSVLFYLYSR